MHVNKLPPVVRFVRKLGPYFLRREVAEALGVSENRLASLAARNPELGPSRIAEWAGGTVALYTAEDVDRLQEHVGPPDKRQLWTSEEYHDRQRRGKRAHDGRKRAEQLEEQGQHAKAAQARAAARRLSEELAREREQRQISARYAAAQRRPR